MFVRAQLSERDLLVVTSRLNTSSEAANSQRVIAFTYLSFNDVYSRYNNNKKEKKKKTIKSRFPIIIMLFESVTIAKSRSLSQFSVCKQNRGTEMQATIEFLCVSQSSMW